MLGLWKSKQPHLSLCWQWTPHSISAFVQEYWGIGWYNAIHANVCSTLKNLSEKKRKKNVFPCEINSQYTCSKQVLTNFYEITLHWYSQVTLTQTEGICGHVTLSLCLCLTKENIFPGGRRRTEEFFHPPTERSDFYAMAELTKLPVFFTPVADPGELTSKVT